MPNRNGRRTESVTFLKRSGHPVTWAECCSLRVEFIEPKTQQSVSQPGSVGLRRNMPFLVKATQDPGLEAGLLMRQCRSGELPRYWSADSRAQQRDLRDCFIMTCREFVGIAAVYYRKTADGYVTYDCRAQPVHENLDAALAFGLEVTQIRLEFLLIELQWPFWQHGDYVMVQGVKHLADGMPAQAYDGYSCVVNTLHSTSPAVAISA